MSLWAALRSNFSVSLGFGVSPKWCGINVRSERRKVCRKIKHVKKELDNADMSPDNLASLRETLFAHRVDLNYILVRVFRLNEK